MGITTDELRILLSVNGTSSYVNTMQQVTRATGGFDNAAGKLISTLARLVSSAAIIKFSKQCIEAASDLQEVANVMNVTFGKNADIIDKWAKTSASSFGLSETSAKRYLGTFGTMASQFGFTADQAANMSIALTGLAGDVASFYNMEDSAAAKKLESIFTGETETLKALGVVMTETNLNAYAMEKGLSKTVKQMSENEKVALRYSFVTDKLSHAQGDFARTSDGWANSVRLLKLNFENLKIEIGNELLPVAGQGLALINQGLKAISPVLVGVTETVRYYAEAWKNASIQTKGLVKAALSFVVIGAAIPKIVALMQGAVKLLTAQIVGLNGALSVTMGILGIVLGAIAFKQLTDQMKELKKASETAESISDIGTSAETSSNAVEDLSDAMTDLGSATEGLDTFLASFDEVNKVGGNNSLMSNLVNTDDLSNILGMADGIEDIQSKLSSLDVPQIDTPQIDILDPEWWKKKWEEIKKTVKGFFKTLFKPSEFWDNWIIGAEEIVNTLKERFPKITRFFLSIGENVADVFSKIKDTISGWLDAVKEKADALSNAIENTTWFKYFARAGSNLYDLQHENDTEKDDTFMYTSRSGITREALKYNADGTESELYKNYQASQGKKVNQTNITNNSSPTTVQVNPTILLDGRKITGAVIDGINAITRSSGRSPLVE